MQRAPHQRTPEPTWVLGVLRRHLADTASPACRLHIPSLTGHMRHMPGTSLHAMPELFFQLAGGNRIDFPGERHLLKAGRACLVPSGLPHRETFIPVRGHFRMLVFMFYGDRITYHLCTMADGGPSAEERHGMVATADALRIASTLDDLARLAQVPTPLSAEARAGLSRGIMAWLGLALKRGAITTPYSLKVVRVLHLVAKNLEDPDLGTATLARQIGCAPDYLSYLFHKETSTPLVQHIQRERVNKAQYLLNHSTMSIKQVAHTCGFSSPDYFGRLFRRLTTMPPSECRPRHGHQCRPAQESPGRAASLTPRR